MAKLSGFFAFWSAFLPPFLYCFYFLPKYFSKLLKFAKFYRFNNQNAILYNDLSDGMRNALKTTSDQYKKFIKELDITASEIETESAENLRRILDV